MELKKLKARLNTAVRGHKLLKDKSDEMVRQFSLIIKENLRLREEVERALSQTLRQFSVARSITPAYAAETAFAIPSAELSLSCGEGSVMGVAVPEVEADTFGTAALPYTYSEITSEADFSVSQAASLVPKMARLAAVEKTVRLLANEIERNKRRVNALEYVMIPQLEETIHYIKSKLDENERAAVIRLMKVKGNGATQIE
jgi:V/A-type H+-transporting ATPase subunit D